MLIDQNGVPHYVISKADMVRLAAYINTLRLAFQENLVSLKRCAGQ